jgi:hypothetical protein
MTKAREVLTDKAMNADHKERVTELGFQAQIYTDLEAMPDRLVWPDKSNSGRRIAALALWKRVADLAEKKYDKLLAEAIEEKLIKDPKSITTPGTYEIGKGGHMTVECNVSVPRREFNMEWFAQKLYEGHQVPPPETKHLMETAKQPGGTQIRRLTILDRGTKI